MKKKFLTLAAVFTTMMGLTACQKGAVSQVAETATNDTAAIVLNNIMTRHSIRQYTDQKLDSVTLNTLLKAGMAAPSAADKRPWSFIVVTDPVIKQSITDNIGPAGPASRAPQIIVVAGDMSKAFEGENQAYWIEDCSAVCENVLLAAHGLGLGAVWLGIYPSTRRGDFMSQLLQLPSHIKTLGIIAVGYPAEAGEIKDKWNASVIHTNTWNNAKDGETEVPAKEVEVKK